ncbi:type II secretion system ATPase GspE [Erwinia tracheiphila]|uniref:Type II secretion system protein E n=1 Tax=Erwinia tracheiphila TaxID=65700 RepID=A0A345CWA3_9GAMM|nr:type II secretion system ATPase GspE [Erwinia tracheiphila]AXF77720.1 type II secretion system protein GspE [Erwinia tracheiphila]UIA83594.1 type II secretion system ATPase GspE [Erwinia tracheiphila]UIA92179.1 type II secretion system ATPase GspE [Erwinia tracheiphila]
MKGKLLSLEWSQQHGILLGEQDSTPALFYRSGVAPLALMSAMRSIGSETPLLHLDDESFSSRLISRFQHSSSGASEVMAELGSELDMYQLADALPNHEELMNEDSDAPIVRLINAILSQAIKERASDVHIEPFGLLIAVRFRIDGVLHKMLEPERRLASMLVSRIKVMSKLDIAEKRMPQDGRISLRLGHQAIDVRVSVIPCSHGERVVMRLLDKNVVPLSLSHLGMSEALCKRVMMLANRPNGIFLVTGPTGSGKSTTLYAVISALNRAERNIMTIEDPVEYDIAGISQTQVNPKVEMTFAHGLRAILRQDPDVILIGEIRDRETAQIAVQASLTGHMVLATLHTNTSVGAITRLQDMGVEPFLLSGSLSGVLAQRLVRRLCKHCRRPVTLIKEECQSLGVPWRDGLAAWVPGGCEHCHHSGYRGRTSLHEILVLNGTMRSRIHQNVNEAELVALSDNFMSLRLDGFAKILVGVTSVEEVLRATGEVEGNEI